jgi:hypothetical protein
MRDQMRESFESDDVPIGDEFGERIRECHDLRDVVLTSIALRLPATAVPPCGLSETVAAVPNGRSVDKCIVIP